MKINDPLGNSIASTVGSKEVTSVESGQRGRAAGEGPALSDQVDLSRLSHYLNILRPDSPQHTAVIGRLSAAVSSGAYPVDPPAVSESIIQAHLAA